jgi:hypothetical protein
MMKRTESEKKKADSIESAFEFLAEREGFEPS